MGAGSGDDGGGDDGGDGGGDANGDHGRDDGEDDGDGEDAWGGASDDNDDVIVDDHVIVPEQRLVKRPLVTEWCLDEDGQDEQGLPEGQNLQMYSALQRL